MGHLAFGGMQRLNIEAARRQQGQDLLQTPNPGLPPSAGNGTPISLSTPDILNSIIAIANPFFESATLPDETETLTQQDFNDEPQEKKIFANLETPLAAAVTSANQSHNNNQNQNIYSSGNNVTTTSNSQLNCMAGSPHSITSTSTSTLSESGVSSPSPQQHQQQRNFNFNIQQPSSSVESMRSKLIKDSLKLTIQTKRKNSGKEELDVKSELVVKRPKREEVEFANEFSLSNDSYSESFPPTKLTPEDEERRRRRRERNKVAATKCRNKKKEKTVLLVQEAEILETDNVTLKSEIAQMEAEFKRLSGLLEIHEPICPINNNQQEQKPLISSISQQQQQHHHHHPMQDLGGHQTNMSYTSTGASNVLHHQQQQHDYNNPQQQDLNHLEISTHHHHNNHNHFMGSSSNMNYFGGTLHHQTIQLS